MANLNLMELLMRKRQNELRREAERQRRIQEALAGRQAGRTPAWRLLAAQGSRIMLWLGHRLLAWGERLQPTTRC